MDQLEMKKLAARAALKYVKLDTSLALNTSMPCLRNNSSEALDAATAP